MGRAVSLIGAPFALLGLVLVLFMLPAGAQDGGIPPGTAANGVDTDNNNSPPDVIVVAASGCVVAAGSSITLEDGDGTLAIFTDGDRGITILAQDGHPRIVGPPPTSSATTRGSQLATRLSILTGTTWSSPRRASPVAGVEAHRPWLTSTGRER